MVMSAAKAGAACALCGGAGRPWLTIPGDWRRPGDDGPYRLRWCDACDFGYLWPRPENRAEAYRCDYYTHGAAAPQPGGRADRLWKAVAWRLDRGEHLGAEYLGRIAPDRGRVLDVGCGDGSLLAGLAERGWSCVGVEPDPEAAEVARGRGLEVHGGTAEDLDGLLGPEAAFDLVVISHALEHCAEPAAAARAAARRLRPGGTLVCEVPNNAAAGLRLRRECWYWLDVPRHLNFFTAASLAAIWAAAGVRRERTEYCGYTRQFGAEWVAAERTIGAALGLPLRGGRGLLLPRTLLAGPGAKYDSVRLIGRAQR